jgi:hypothetical protein
MRQELLELLRILSVNHPSHNFSLNLLKIVLVVKLNVTRREENIPPRGRVNPKWIIFRTHLRDFTPPLRGSLLLGGLHPPAVAGTGGTARNLSTKPGSCPSRPNAPGESKTRIHRGYQTLALRAFSQDLDTSISSFRPLTCNFGLLTLNLGPHAWGLYSNSPKSPGPKKGPGYQTGTSDYGHMLRCVPVLDSASRTKKARPRRGGIGPSQAFFP